MTAEFAAAAGYDEASCVASLGPIPSVLATPEGVEQDSAEALRERAGAWVATLMNVDACTGAPLPLPPSFRLLARRPSASPPVTANPTTAAAAPSRPRNVQVLRAYYTNLQNVLSSYSIIKVYSVDTANIF